MKRTIEEGFIEGRPRQFQMFFHLYMPPQLVREELPVIRHSPNWALRQGPDGELRMATPLPGVGPRELMVRAVECPAPGQLLPVNAVLEGSRIVRLQRPDCYNLED